MRLSAVFACVRVISETVGSLPLVIYRRRKDGGKERADNHPLADVFRKPNLWQTGFEFWEMMQAHLELRGNAFAEIVTGNGRAIDELIPLHPDRVRVFRLPNGKLRYDVTSYFDGTIRRLAQEEMLHLRGLSSDGIIGISTITAASEVVGAGLAQQEYGSRFFSNNAKPGVALISASKLDKEAKENLQETFSQGFSGANAFKTAVLPPGMDIKVLGLTNKDSQLIEARQATRTDIASMFRVQPHKIGDLTRGTFSNIEQQNIEFATDSIRPRVVRLERRINLDLLDALGIGEAGDFFADFGMDALFRGDMKSRYDAYNTALQFWLTVNEVRAMENLNPIDGGDVIIRPVNMSKVEDSGDTNQETDTEEQNQDSASPDSDPSDDEEQAKAGDLHLRALVMSAAGRVVRREVKTLRKLSAQKLDEPSLRAELDAFYGGLTGIIAENLVMPAAAAKTYVDRHSKLITSAKSERLDEVIELIEEESPAMLAEMALESRKSSAKR